MTLQPIRGWAASGLLAGALVLSACGSGEDTAKSSTPGAAAKTSTPTPTEVAAPAPAGMRGSWKRTMTTRDWGSKGYPVGTWRFDVAKDGTVEVYLPATDTVDFSTRFVESGKRLTIEDIPICPGTTGRYTWHASAKALTLSVIHDQACPPRAALFGGTWQRRH